MAVYTQLGGEALAELIGHFDVGALISAKGIAEGVSNSNWLIETTGHDGHGARYILTVYEARTEIAGLPFFLGLLDHLAAKRCPVPRTVHDRAGAAFRMVRGKPAALIEFLPGVSVESPTPAQAGAVGAALARLHLGARDFPQNRANSLGPAQWRTLFTACGESGLGSIDPALAGTVARQLERVTAAWPAELPRGVIHADLFPDNVLMLGDEVSGLIDFYFACTDLLAYDVAVTHAAWCFDAAGHRFDAAASAALLAGYDSVRALGAAERAALPMLASAASLRFLATRAYDWLHTPADALVTRKDPLAFARRLAFYADPAQAGIFA
ncbi:MAG: homoserine kinase [Sphingomonadales bacterium]|nr:homoserine kinase [Sphingomonadales bacterium]